MSTSSSSRNPVEVLAEEFLDRRRRGEPTSPEEYAERHPEFAGEILEVFPALLTIENHGGDAASVTGLMISGAEAVAGAALGQLGEFRLLREIGRGGMGVVYEAEQQSLGRRVAVKVLPAGALSDARQVQRFEREARSAARLHHTHIVPVFGVGSHEGTHFYVMQFIDGQGLDAVLRELQRLRDARSTVARRSTKEAREGRRPAALEIAVSLATGCFVAGPDGNEAGAQSVSATHVWSAPAPQSPSSGASSSAQGLASLTDGSGVTTISRSERRFTQSVARIGVQVAEALAYSHAQGILHRDIKPSNLLLDRDGNIWVADFGLAKAIGGDDLTHTGDVVGTLRYMAPERFEGRADARSDIYALGLTLYELLALRPAYSEPDHTKLIRQVMQEEPPRLRRLNRSLPADLETIVHKAMAREADRRYPAATDLAEDLRRFLEGRPILARQASAIERAWRWCRRNPLVAALIGGIALALVVGAAVSISFGIAATRNSAAAMAYAHRADLEAERANQAARKAIDEAGRADREARRAREEKLLSDSRLYVAEMNLAQQAWKDGLTDVVKQRLNAHEPVRADDQDLRGFEWYYLDRLCRSELRTMRGHTHNVMGVAYSPDGRRIASASEDGTVRLWETATGNEVRTLRGHDSNVLDVAYSPDGRCVASASMDRTARVWDAETGRQLLVLRGHTGWVLVVAYSPDGRRIASAGDDYTVKVWDSHTGQLVRTLGGRDGSVWGVAFSPDGQLLASGCASGAVRIWDISTGQNRVVLRGHLSPVWDVAYSPDGRIVASAGHDRTVRLWHAGTGQELQTLRGHSARVFSVSFSRDSRILASASEDRTVRLWDVATGGNPFTLRGHEAPVWDVEFSPDGRTMATASNDRTVKLWEANPEPEFTPLSGHLSGTACVAFGLEGCTLASASDDATVRLWDAATGRESRTLRSHTGSVYTLAISPDGRTLASGSGDHTVKLWDLATGLEIRVLRGHASHVVGVAFGPDGRTLATAGDDASVRLWDVTTGRTRLVMHGQSAETVSFHPDGRTLAIAGNEKTVRLLDVTTGRVVQSVSGYSGPVWGVAFSPDGRRFASAGDDATVRLWDVTSGHEVLTLRGHSAQVWGVAFSPDGRRLASVGGDATVRLWDVTTGQEVLTLRGHATTIRGVAFSPDGRRIASAADDGTLAIWDAMPVTPEREEHREARGVVEFLFAKSLSAATVLARIGEDPTLSESVRRRALDLAVHHEEARINREAERAVFERTRRAMLRREVRESVRTDSTLSEPVRSRALALVEEMPEDARALYWASWSAARQPGAEVAAYRRALLQAEAACRLIPGDIMGLAACGMALYRLGRYQEAAATLERAGQIGAVVRDRSQPGILAILALAQHRLGRTAKARAALNRLREKITKGEWDANAESRSLLREAEMIESDLAFPANPFAP